MAGYDVDPAIALHPTEGWAAVVWANWIEGLPDEATVYVKVQSKDTHTWKSARGVNIGSVEKNAGAPAIAIDRGGRIHVVYLSNADYRHPEYTYSDDQGVTWSDPEPILQPAGAEGMYFPQLLIDQADQLHLLYAATSCFDCFRAIHSEKPARGGGWQSQDQIIPGTKQLFGDLTSIQLDGTIRTIAAVGCRIGCAHGPGVEVAYHDNGGAWINRFIPNQNVRVSPQVVQWVDLIQFVAAGQQYVCVAWGQYAKSAIHVACSTDNGETWSEPEIVAYHNRVQEPGEPDSPTPTIDPNAGPGEPDTGEPLTDRGYHPELIYDPTNQQLIAVWALFESAQPGQPSTLVYSHRELGSRIWTPLIDGGQQEPPLRLFSNTRRSAARNPRIAAMPGGMAAAVWIEIERDESIEVYYGLFTPGALAAQEQ